MTWSPSRPSSRPSPWSYNGEVTPLWRRRIARPLLAVLFWSLIAGIFALPRLASGAGARQALMGSLVQWWAWGLLTPLIVMADRRLPLSSRQPGWRLAAHLLGSLLFTSLYVYLIAAAGALMGSVTWSVVFSAQPLDGALRSMFLWSWLIYWLILGAWLLSDYYRRYHSSELRAERLERSFTEARLRSLRMQLDPHFLFNALNTISSQVERDPKLARAMIGHLGDLLRLSLESRDRQQVPLVEELAFLEHYLAIQQIRFGDRLRVELQIAADARHALVPALLIQPLVENAIRHGIGRRSTPGTVWISASRQADRLTLRVADDGVGLPPGWSPERPSGLGLSLTRERIATLHGDSGHFSVHPRPAGGTEAEISLPLQLREEDSHVSAA